MTQSVPDDSVEVVDAEFKQARIERKRAMAVVVCGIGDLALYQPVVVVVYKTSMGRQRLMHNRQHPHHHVAPAQSAAQVKLPPNCFEAPDYDYFWSGNQSFDFTAPWGWSALLSH